MKKIYLTFFAITCLFASSQAQGLYFRLGGGYALAGFKKTETVKGPKIDPATANQDALVDMANMSDSLNEYSVIHDSYGRGGNMSFTVGYMINPYVGFEMGLSYLIGSKIKCHVNRDVILGGLSYGYMDADITTYANGLSLMPGIYFRAAKPEWKLAPYGHLGISLPVAGKIIHEVEINSPISAPIDPLYLGKKTSAVLESRATLSAGINGAVGLSYTPIPLLTVWVEVNGQYLTVRAKESTITKWDADGVDMLPLRSTYRKEFTYVDDLDGNSNNAQYNAAYDKDKPKEDTRPYVPFSNFGFNVGLTVNISKDMMTKKSKK